MITGMDDDDGQMIFGVLMGLKLPDIRLTGEEKHRKNLTQETCPDRGSNPGPLRERRACYHLFHSVEQVLIDCILKFILAVPAASLVLKSFCVDTLTT